MESTIALTVGIVALMLSISAVVLATVANRRHMDQRRSLLRAVVGPSAGRPTGAGSEASDSEAVAVDAREAILKSVRARLNAVDGLVAELAETVAQLQDVATASQGQWDELNARVRSATERADQLAERLQTTEELSAGHAHSVEAQVDSLSAQVTVLREHVLSADPTALRHVAIVRYDAFADVGGRLSYSLAVLDDTGAGFVVTTLSGKSEVRTYVRAVEEGAGEGNLTVEEQQAIEAARQGAGSRP